jgi:hypothetical protein
LGADQFPLGYEQIEVVFLDLHRDFRHRHACLCLGDILVRSRDFHELID